MMPLIPSPGRQKTVSTSHAISRSTSSSEAIFSGIGDEAARRRSTPFRCDHANRASASDGLDKRGCAQVPATPNVPIEPLELTVGFVLGFLASPVAHSEAPGLGSRT
jgi:hypothetical protein